MNVSITYGGHTYTGESRSLASFSLPIIPPTAEEKAQLAKLNDELKYAEAQEKNPALRPVADNAPEKAFKQVMVNGKVAATIYESGVMSFSDEFSQMHNLPFPMEASSPTQLAMQRAEMLAKALGGEIQDAPKTSRLSVMA